jgi:hypothetical protein
MKSLLVVICILCSISAKAQYCRAVHSIDDTGPLNHRGTAITEFGDETFFVTISTSVDDTLNFTVANLDSRGETSNYVDSILYSIPGIRYAISGMATNGDDLIVVVLAESTTTASLSYLRYNTISASIVEVVTLPTDFNRGYVRSRQKGDSIITYIAHPAGTSRIGTNLSGTFTPANVDYTTTMMYNSGGMSTGQRKTEFIIADSGIEYVTLNNTVQKRSAAGTYQEIALPGFLGANGFTMNLNNLNELLVISGQNYYLFNTSFSIINQGVFSFSTGAPTRFTELFYRNGYWCLFYRASAPNTSTKAVINNNLDIVSEFPLNGGDVSLYDQYETVTGRYVVGYQSHAIQRESVVIIKDVDLQSPGIFYEYTQQIDHNALEFYTGHLGVIFQTDEELYSGFLIEHEGVNKGVFFRGSTTILGKSPSGDTIGMLPWYNNVQNIYPGPYTPVQNRSFESMDKYNRGLYVDKAMIDDHIAQISNSTPNYEIPLGILNWPANGNVSIGQADKIAPFFDQNGNQIYEPELGDYPSIYGNRCVLNIFHQAEDAFLAGESDLNMECLQYIYVYDCDSNEALMNTVFVSQSFNIYNSSIDSAYVGAFTDLDIGNYADDYSGTFVDLGMHYEYNADLYDEDVSGMYATVGFHEHPPAAGALYLRGAKAKNDGIDNAVGVASDQSVNGFGFGDLIIDNEYFGLVSSYTNMTSFAYATPKEFYNWIQGKDATGNYTQVNGVDTRHHFFGNSDLQFYSAWGLDHGNNHSEVTAGTTPGDRYIHGGSGPFSMNSEDSTTNTMQFLTAYIVAIDSILLPTDPNGDPVQKLHRLGQAIKEI